ncbi:MAG: GGDEF domain-containing protein [Gammaproteobacteria bacterium]|nr:GGDEF domain-containing protein [Gammaproteobacteria bacterium]
MTATDYASALEHGTNWLRFEPPVEAAFRHSHIMRVRTQARFWQSLQLTVGLAGIGMILAGPSLDSGRMLLLACNVVHLSVSVALVLMAFSRAYASSYLWLATIMTPFRAAAAAVAVAAIIDAGSSGTAVMTINMFGLLFFSGLLLRQALPAAMVMIVSFVAALIVFEVPAVLAAYSVTSLLLVFGLAGYVAWDMQRAARVAFLENGLTRVDATRDALTGLVNRRHLDSRLATLWQTSAEERQPLTVLLIDVDHFKAYNDGYGHQAGDEVLRRVARTMRTVARERDIVARFGGEEFVLLAYGLKEQEAETLANELRRAVEALAIPHLGAPAIGKISVSIGGACVVPLPGRSAAGVLQLADQNLYAAKRQGRNQVVFHAGEYEMMQTGVFKSPGPGRASD